MRRATVPVSPESPCRGPKKEGSIASESLARCKAMEPWRFTYGARLVPWRTLHPYRAGLDPRALHTPQFLYSKNL